MKKISLIMMAVAVLMGAATIHAASSANFSITSSVLGGGGGAASSANFRTGATAGQPTPIMDPTTPPQSASYDNFPGFWYTLDAAACVDLATFAAAFGTTSLDVNYSGACDFDADGDVDGTDLSEFIN